ncbi:hypothetical protein QTP86_020129, partial [Hemibagrus guttatus]
IFYNRYAVGHLLGKGGNGSVFAGVRRSDGKKVALKFVRKSVNDKYITVPGGTRRLPVEVALMELVCKPPHFPFVIELLEWFETPVGFIIVLERPYPCVDLYKFCRHVALSEAMAKIIMQQVIQAALHCRERGVFHRDIKEENILINTQTLEVKLIDFGCGDLHKDTPYNEYCGTCNSEMSTPICYPPEWISSRMCEAESATVWTLGVLLYSMLCGHKPFFRLGDIVHRQQLFPTYLSKCEKIQKFYIQTFLTSYIISHSCLQSDKLVSSERPEKTANTRADARPQLAVTLYSGAAGV